MLTLYLIRHAKSSWKNPELSDFDRPLNDRGKNDAPLMGKALKNKNFNPDLFYSSPAKRAYATAKKIADEINYPLENIIKEPDIYEANPDQLLNIIKSWNNSSKTIALTGHNPGLTWLANYLCNEEIANIPTTGVVCINFDVNSWNQVGQGSGKLQFFEYPKMYKKTIWTKSLKP